VVGGVISMWYGKWAIFDDREAWDKFTIVSEFYKTPEKYGNACRTMIVEIAAEQEDN
jgi:hypothetical protein